MAKKLTKEQADALWTKAHKRMEAATQNVAAFIIIGPSHDRADARRYQGRVVITYPNDGMGWARAVAFLPGNPDGGMDGMTIERHHGAARGCGYDKATAAMGGARFWNAATRAWCVLVDQGWDWKRQLEDAGYSVYQAV